MKTCAALLSFVVVHGSENADSACGGDEPTDSAWPVRTVCIHNKNAIDVLQFKSRDVETGKEGAPSQNIRPGKTECYDLSRIDGIDEGKLVSSEVWNPLKLIFKKHCDAKQQVRYKSTGVKATYTCKSISSCTLDGLDEQCLTEGNGTASADWDLLTLVDGTEWGGRWKNWFENVVTCDTLLFPKNDDELKAYLVYARSKNYKVRITGGTHSASGLVSEGSDEGTNTLVMSLGRYHVSDSSWCSQGDFCLDQANGVARANAGRSWLDLYQEIRPLGWFIPTQTAGYFFSIAGTVLGTVHGGAYGKTFLHGYVRRMRVMLWDGTVQVIEGDEIRNWRSSYGLLGVLTAVEVEVIKRDTFQMYTKTSSYQDWNEQNFWKFVGEDAEADLDLSFFPGSKSYNMSRESIYGEYFLDFLTDATGHAKFRTQGVLWKTPPNPPVHKTEDELRKAYEKSEESKGIIREQGGSKINILNDVLHNVPLTNTAAAANLLMEANFLGQNRYVATASKTVNDGYWVEGAPNVNIAAYFVPIENSFEAFDYVRSQVRARHYGKDRQCYKHNNPVEYRFVEVTDDSLLQIVPPGKYVVSEILGFVDAAPKGDSWQRAYAEIECDWTTRLGAKPHLMKLHSFGLDQNGNMQPNQPCNSCSHFTHKQKYEFELVRSRYDPHGMFATGSAYNVLLQPCPNHCPVAETRSCPVAGTPDCGSPTTEEEVFV